MADVVLIGDSIRMGYEATVRDQLPDLDIWSPEQNGGDSQRVRDNLEEWVIAHTPKVAHINCGLHDLKKDFETSTPQVSLSDYRDNLTNIITRLSDQTDAIVIFALTTPVNEQWHHKRKGFDRFEADVVSYNEVAREICATLNVQVNDLFSVITKAGRDDLLNPDGVHFGEAGYNLLGKTVAATVRDAL